MFWASGLRVVVERHVELSVPGLLAGLFGTRAHMARVAERGRWAAKAAARVSGAKGGGRGRLWGEA